MLKKVEKLETKQKEIEENTDAENDSVDSEDVKGMLKQSLGKQLVLRLLCIMLLFPH